MSELAMQSEAVDTSNALSQPSTGETEVASEPVESVDYSAEPEVTGDAPDVSHEVSQEAEHQEGEVNSNAENAKRRIDKKSRKMQRRLEEMEAKLQQYEQQQYQQPESYAQPDAQNMQPQNVVDPITGEYLTPGTPRYEVVNFQNQQQMLHQQRLQQQQQQEFERYQREQDEKFFDALDDASDKYEDFDRVVRDDNLPLTEAMLGVAKVTPNGADLLYYLAKNPKEVQRISKLHPLVQQQEMAKHAIQFASRNQVSKAPPPVKTVGDTSNVRSSNSVADLSKDISALRQHLKAKQWRM